MDCPGPRLIQRGWLVAIIHGKIVHFGAKDFEASFWLFYFFFFLWSGVLVIMVLIIIIITRLRQPWSVTLRVIFLFIRIIRRRRRRKKADEHGSHPQSPSPPAPLPRAEKAVAPPRGLRSYEDDVGGCCFCSFSSCGRSNTINNFFGDMLQIS